MRVGDSIRKRLTLTFVLSTICPLILLGMVLSWLIFSTQQAQLLDLQHEVLARAVSEIRMATHEQETRLTLAVATTDLMDLDRARQFAVLSMIRSFKDTANHDVVDDLSLVDRNGKELARDSRTKNYRPVELSERSDDDAFLVPISTGHAYYSPVTLDAVTSEPFASVGIPIEDNQSQEVRGVLIARIRLQKIWGDIVGRPFAGMGALFITDHVGMVVAHPNPSVVLRGTIVDLAVCNGVQAGISGGKVVRSCNPFRLGNQEFFVVVEMPFHEAMGLSYQAFSAMAVFLVFFLVISLYIGFALVRRVVGPIESLAETAQAISRGDLDRKASEEGTDEIGALAVAFNSMVARLLHDIDERKRAEAALHFSEERYRAITTTAQDAILMIDSDGRLSLCNPAAERIFGYTEGELVGHELERLLAPESGNAFFRQWLAEFRQTGRGPGAGRTIELEAARKDGRTFPIELSLATMTMVGNGGWSAIGIARDVTRRKQDEAALVRARAELELRVEERTAELAGANKELQDEIVVRKQAEDAAAKANKAKSEFLANMSHEIRTPMNGIIGYTDLLLGVELPEAQRSHLCMVKTASMRLLDIINDILDFSKIEAGKLMLDFSPFSLREMLDEALKILAINSTAKGLELVYRVRDDVPDGLEGDSGRLRQVFVNLVGNAVKFTQRGEVAVSVEVAERRDDDSVELLFMVRDTGEGIAEDKKALIFESFSQADASMTRRFGGTGLGLAISSQLVQLMGGKIWVESRLGEGSTFRFTALFRQQPSAAMKLAAVAPERLRRRSALIVVENSTSRHFLAEMLGIWLEVVETAAGPQAALAVLARRSFDLVLIDHNLTGGESLGLAGEIGRRCAAAMPRLIILTPATDWEKTVEAGGKSLISGYLAKPVSQADLLRVVQEALGDLAPGEGVAPPADPHRPQAEHRNGHILLAEDEHINQTLAIILLEREGWRVTVAGNGREALQAMDTTDFDLVLMDVQMPEMDGIEATRRIRAREAADDRHIPIVAMTAHAMKDDRERCLSAGMDDYLAKPIVPENLFAVLEKYIGTQELVGSA